MQTVTAVWHRTWPLLAKLYLLAVGAISLAFTLPRLYRTLYLGQPTMLADYGFDLYVCAAGVAILFMLARLWRA